jgi:hypothetical protein
MALVGERTLRLPRGRRATGGGTGMRPVGYQLRTKRNPIVDQEKFI